VDQRLSRPDDGRVRSLPPPIGYLVLAAALCGLGTARAAGWLAAPPSEPCTLAKVMDGDSLRLDCRGEEVEVRLHCIDAPEYGQVPWGRRAASHLRRLAAGDLELRAIELDRFGRTVGEVYTLDPDPSLLNLEQVRAGHAAVYHRFCDDPAYLKAEREAEGAGLGIWSQPGEHQTPWRYRQRRR
jgi:endonuclease YncB( thermonuclease family)